jgi:hypothetical protein
VPLPTDQTKRVKVIERARKCFARLGSNTNEAEAARQKLMALLAKYGLTWNHLEALLRTTAAATA